MSGRALRIPRRPRRLAALLLAVPALGLALYFLLPLPRPLFAPDYSTLVVDREGRLLRAFLNDGQQWCFPPDSSLAVPAKLRAAVIHFEDRQFDRHRGVNPLALARALYQNAAAGEVRSGASTLTMQVARLMRPKPRTYLNKALETLLAVKIELYHDKDGILRLYLDHAPYGGNIVGYQAAAVRYFRKRPEELTWSEAATLAVLPNAPGLVSPTADPRRLEAKRNRLLAGLHRAGLFDAETLSLAAAEPVSSRAWPLPVTAPHLSRALKSRRPGRLIRTTLDAGLQRELETLVARHLGYLDHLGIGNGAALLVETGSGEVRAYVGSRDFFDAGHQGQVDGVTAPRSSGSLLKPFLYALSMDEGLVLPGTLVKDVPTFYQGFSPRNADESYDGLVRAGEALVRSLNVPAVRLLRRYGLFNFHRFLQDAGLSTLVRTADDYGLPLILGGAEVTLWDMARLFRGLARGGRVEPLRYLPGEGEAGAPAGAPLQRRRRLAGPGSPARGAAPRGGVLLAPVRGPVAPGLEDGHQLRPARRLGRGGESLVDDRRLARQLHRRGQPRAERGPRRRPPALRHLPAPAPGPRPGLVPPARGRSWPRWTSASTAAAPSTPTAPIRPRPRGRVTCGPWSAAPTTAASSSTAPGPARSAPCAGSRATTGRGGRRSIRPTWCSTCGSGGRPSRPPGPTRRTARRSSRPGPCRSSTRRRGRGCRPAATSAASARASSCAPPTATGTGPCSGTRTAASWAAPWTGTASPCRSSRVPTRWRSSTPTASGTAWGSRWCARARRPGRGSTLK